MCRKNAAKLQKCIFWEQQFLKNHGKTSIDIPVNAFRVILAEGTKHKTTKYKTTKCSFLSREEMRGENTRLG